MDTDPLQRLDSFPYRHRVGDLMASPVISLPGEATVAEAARIMSWHRISSVVVLDSEGRSRGILTERDVLRLVAHDPVRLGQHVGDEMTAPVHGIAADALVYRALARMARLGVRHLPVLDEAGHPLGMLTAGALLRQRASLALTLGDEIEHAPDGAALRTTHDRLPTLATSLRREDVSGVQVSAVISAIIGDLTARAAELALATMREEGFGEPPAAWCLLVLGSAGRGESLLAADQDNALIHDGTDTDDAWFGAFGSRLNALLDTAGVPLCKGGVMVGNAAFRKSLTGWRASIDAWVSRPTPNALMNVDIFYDFAPVLGERRLAAELRRHAVGAAASSPIFLRLMADAGESVGRAFDLLGRLRTIEGRIDLKRHGLFPVVAAARTIALACRSNATATDARLSESASKGALSHDTALELAAARAVVVEAVLDQQLADMAAGLEPSNLVDPRRLKRTGSRRLRHALETIAGAPDAVRGALTSRTLERAP